ncbi:MAG: hypothetical protein IKE95_06400 [Methanobrevibacter sp.]|nr:hypothetical protein [Methanobrevibacter sp.]
MGLRGLYKKLKKTEKDDSDQILAEFSRYFVENDWRATREIKTFCVVSDWIETSVKILALEFYEYDALLSKNNDIQDTIDHLNELGEMELAGMIAKGIHDYSNPQYSCICDYPKEWVDDCFDIDSWIKGHRVQLRQWLYDYLLNIEDSIS